MSEGGLFQQFIVSISIPYINGENDPFGTCAELLEKVPAAKAYEVKDGGHHPHFVGEQIDEINAMMLKFLSTIDGK